MSSGSREPPPDISGYRFVRHLGDGGYGGVFLYEQISPKMPVAVKVLFSDGLTDLARTQFAAEANAMAELADHPNIVQVFRADVTDSGQPYMVMKYYPGENLEQRARSEQISVAEILKIGVRISCAVETAHRAGILHRDIKPANILTSQYGEPGLTDFGIATKGDVAESEGLSIPWSAPEVVFSTSAGGRTSDVYSLGATLWNLLTGHSPFMRPRQEKGTAALMRRIREDPPPRTGRDDVPESLERLLAQTMSKDPLSRPQSALDLALALQAIEVEQRWAPTQLVLHDEGRFDRSSAGRESGQEEDDLAVNGPAKTRLKRPPSVVAQGTTTVPGAFTEPSTRLRPPRVTPQGHDRKNRERVGIPPLADQQGTIKRPETVRPGGIDSESSTPDRDATREPGPHVRRRRATLAVVTGLVLLAVVGVGIALMTSGHGPTGPTTSITTAGIAPTLPIPAQPPVLTATPAGQGLWKYSWTDPDAQRGDKFVWTSAQGGQGHPVSGDSVTLPASDGCIQVVLIRDNQETPSNDECPR